MLAEIYGWEPAAAGAGQLFSGTLGRPRSLASCWFATAAQTDEDAANTVMEVPVELVPVFRQLIAEHEK